MCVTHVPEHLLPLTPVCTPLKGEGVLRRTSYLSTEKFFKSPSRPYGTGKCRQGELSIKKVKAFPGVPHTLEGLIITQQSFPDESTHNSPRTSLEG